MNRESREHWINEILNEVFLAVIASEPLRNALIFKGARILNLHLGDSRSRCSFGSNCGGLLSSGNGVLSMFSDIVSPGASDGVSGRLTAFDATASRLVTGFGNPKPGAAL